MITPPCAQLVGRERARMVCKSAAKGQFWGSNSDKNFWNFRLQLVTPKSSSCKAHGTRSSLKSCCLAPDQVDAVIYLLPSCNGQMRQMSHSKACQLTRRKKNARESFCRFTAACILDHASSGLNWYLHVRVKHCKTTFMQEFSLRTNSQWRVSHGITRINKTMVCTRNCYSFLIRVSLP